MTGRDRGDLGALDRFRCLAVLLVVANHTSPLASFSPTADFLLTRVAARVAVPFFLMTTGFFLLPRYLFSKGAGLRPFLRQERKAAILYLLAALLYLPVNLYAGQLEGLGPLDALRLLLFDGTYYHLWYLPALLLGLGLVLLLSRLCPARAVTAAAAALYLLGLLGDSYYGLTCRVPALAAAYEGGFRLFSYTRNGLFLAPLFLVLGAWCSRLPPPRRRSTAACVCAGSLLLLAAEGLTLRFFDLPRHDSMYLLLPVCMLSLFRLLLTLPAPPSPLLRKASLWAYLLHPLCILAVRGGAKALGLTGMLMDNSLIHFLAVCALSGALALGLSLASQRRAAPAFRQGRAWIELSRSSLRHNVEALRALLPEGCRLMPAVKANAYGHGGALIARELNALGVRDFCVATVREGAELRRRGVRGDILVLGYTHPKEFPALRRYRLIQTVVDEAHAEALGAYGKKLRVHLALDTGMHRLGGDAGDLDALLRICSHPNLRIEGAFTHLCADDTGDPECRAYTLAQAQAFDDAVRALRLHGRAIPKTHLWASYGLFNYPGLHSDYARIGIALYGLLSTRADTDACPADLRPVLSLKARVSSVRTLAPGMSAGYGLAFTALRETRLAVLAIGYADGLPRSLSCGVGGVLLHGCYAPIVGRICMDQTLVDVTELPAVHQGDTAVLIGRSGALELTACDLAERADTLSNEILSRLGGRLERELI